MDRIKFGQLPLAVKIAVGLVFMLAWVFGEQYVIEANGLQRYMPYYWVQGFCVWDLGIGLIIAFTTWRASRSRVSRTV